MKPLLIQGGRPELFTYSPLRAFGEVRMERARVRRRPPSAACEPSHWDLVRNAVRLRSIAFYWLGETVATLCAPDGRYSLEDLEAFLRDLEECDGENAC